MYSSRSIELSSSKSYGASDCTCFPHVIVFSIQEKLILAYWFTYCNLEISSLNLPFYIWKGLYFLYLFQSIWCPVLLLLFRNHYLQTFCGKKKKAMVIGARIMRNFLNLLLILWEVRNGRQLITHINFLTVREHKVDLITQKLGLSVFPQKTGKKAVAWSTKFYSHKIWFLFWSNTLFSIFQCCAFNMEMRSNCKTQADLKLEVQLHSLTRPSLASSAHLASSSWRLQE